MSGARHTYIPRGAWGKRASRSDQGAGGDRSPSEDKGAGAPASAGERDQAAFPKGQVGPFAAPDDDVVEDFDVEDLTRLHELASDTDVFGGRSHVPRGMVV